MLVQVVYGDSPAIIARKYGVTMGALIGANPQKPTTIVAGVRTWRDLRPGETVNVPVGGYVGDSASDTAAALAAVNPCDQAYVGMVCSFQSLVGLSPDGKYGGDTAAKGNALGVQMPPGCSPRPTWWAAPGKSNCGQVVPSAPATNLGTIASAAYAALSADSNYCASVASAGSAVNTAIHSFKTAWNAANPGSPVPVGTGKYEPSVAAALSSVLGGQSVPPGCGAPAPAPIPSPVPSPSPGPAPAPLPAPAPAAPAAVQALLMFDPCVQANVAAVCAAQAALGIGADGKYGSDSSNAARRIIPGAPTGCSPRPAWWTPTGQSNCPGAAPPPFRPPPVSVTCPAGTALNPLTGNCDVIPLPPPPPPGPLPHGGGASPVVVAPAQQGGVSTGALVAGAVGAVALVGVIAAASMAGKGRTAGHRGARGRSAHKSTHRKPAHKGKGHKTGKKR